MSHAAAPGTASQVARTPSIRPQPVYVLGDSHAIAYNMRLYGGGGDREYYLFQSLYIPGFNADACASVDGAQAPAIAAALSRAGLLVDVGGRAEARHRTGDPHWRHWYVVEERTAVDPTIVLSIGALDAMHFGVGLSNVDDIALPQSLVEPVGPLSAPPLAGALAFDDAVTLFALRMQPLLHALHDLQQSGFARLALLSVAPPTHNDEAFRAVRKNLGLEETPSHATLAWRTKCALVANTVLGRIASTAGVAFIDRWRDQMRDGLALPGLLGDWMHLSGWAVDDTALAIVERMHDVPLAPARAASYYQIYVDDPGGTNGMREHTIDAGGFAALREAPADAFVMVRDVYERSQSWVNRARIVRIVGEDPAAGG